MRILITGITGRVGANVAKRFVDIGHEVTGLVWSGDRQSEKVAQIGADIVEGDLASCHDVAKATKGADAIFHLGAAFQAGGPFTSEQYFDINVKGTFNVLEAAAASDRLQHVIVTSTDATMDKYPPEGIAEPIREDSLPLVSTGWYGYSKVLTEHLVDRYVRAQSLPATVFRFANAWGAGEVLDYAQFYMRTYMDQFEGSEDVERREAFDVMSKVYDGEPHLIVAADRHGRPWKKHFVEVRDIIHAYENAVRRAGHLWQNLPIGIERTVPLGGDDPVPGREVKCTVHNREFADHAHLLRVRPFSRQTRFQLRPDAVAFWHDRRSDLSPTNWWGFDYPYKVLNRCIA